MYIIEAILSGNAVHIYYILSFLKDLCSVNREYKLENGSGWNNTTEQVR